MRTARRPDRHIRTVQLERQRRQLRPRQRVDRAARPDRRADRVGYRRVNVNCRVKNPNTSIVAVPANANNSPSRSIVCDPTTGAVPSAVAQSNALAAVTVPPAAAPLSSCAPDALL